MHAYDANVSSTSPMWRSITSPVPLHEQVAAAIRRAIAEGEARPASAFRPPGPGRRARGQRQHGVPGAADAARRGAGGVPPRPRRLGHRIGPQRSAVVAKARELVALARRYGYRPEELTEIIEQVSVESMRGAPPGWLPDAGGARGPDQGGAQAPAPPLARVGLAVAAVLAGVAGVAACVARASAWPSWPAQSSGLAGTDPRQHRYHAGDVASGLRAVLRAGGSRQPGYRPAGAKPAAGDRRRRLPAAAGAGGPPAGVRG